MPRLAYYANALSFSSITINKNITSNITIYTKYPHTRHSSTRVTASRLIADHEEKRRTFTIERACESAKGGGRWTFFQPREGAIKGVGKCLDLHVRTWRDEAKVVPVRVLGKCGGTLADIAEGIIWASGGSISGVPSNQNPAHEPRSGWTL